MKDFSIGLTLWFVAGVLIAGCAPEELLSFPTDVPVTAEPTVPPSTPISNTTSEYEIGSMLVRKVDGMEMMYVPEGNFMMGSDTGEIDERPMHEVWLDAYWVDKYEVTNDQFSKFVRETKYQTDAEAKGESYGYVGDWEFIPGANWMAPEGEGSDIDSRQNHPVVHMSWNDANAYCAWVGGNLPSEAQWEKAARGVEDERKYPWGEIINTNMLNYNMSIGVTTEIGSYPDGASPYGLLDMAGNVLEWGNDWYDGEYYSENDNHNPVGPGSGEGKVLRGGAWSARGAVAKVYYRYWKYPPTTNSLYGFRCVINRVP